MWRRCKEAGVQDECFFKQGRNFFVPPEGLLFAGSNLADPPTKDSTQKQSPVLTINDPVTHNWHLPPLPTARANVLREQGFPKWATED
jgi:hypothetical protein